MQYTKEVALLESAFQLAERKQYGIMPRYACLGSIMAENINQKNSSQTDVTQCSPDVSRPGGSNHDSSLSKPQNTSLEASAFSQVADTLINTISEIIAGLEYPANEPEVEHNSFIVHSVLFNCFYKQVLATLYNDEADNLADTHRKDTCHDILDTFPRISPMLYYTIMMISILPVEHSTVILKEILSFCLKEPLPMCEDLTAEIVTGMLPDVISKTPSIVNVVSSIGQSEKLVYFEQWRNLLLLFQILFDMLRKSEGCLDVLHKVTTSCIKRLFNLFNNQKFTFNVQGMEENLQVILEDLQLSTGLSHNIYSDINITTKFYQNLQQLIEDDLHNTSTFSRISDRNKGSCGDSNLNKFVEDFLSTLDKCIGGEPVTDVSKIVQTSNDELGAKERFWKICYHLLNILKQLRKTGELKEKCPNLALLAEELDKYSDMKKSVKDDITKPTQNFEDDLVAAVWIVDNRLIGFEENLTWILNNSCNFSSDELWISCVERNVTSIRKHESIKCLIDCIIHCHLRSSNKIQSKSVERLLKVLVEAFKTVNIGIQNRLRDYFTEEQHQLSYYFYEEYSPLDLQQQLVATFNKLVRSSKINNIHELLQYVSPIAFQSPRQMIQKAVLESINNAGIIPLVTQIFQGMNSLCSYKADSKTTFLCLTLDEKATTLSTPKQQTNFLSLIKALLQPFKSPQSPNYPVLNPAVLASQELLNVCIYPNLHYHKSDTSHHQQNLHCDHTKHNTHPRISLLMCLHLLKITLDAPLAGATVAESIDSEHRFPIMLSLALFINECIVLWDGNEECVNRENVKEICKSILQVLCTSVNEQHTENDTMGVQWLLFNAKSFQWSTELYLHFIVCNFLNSKEVASLFSISNFFNTEWKASHISTECPEKTILTFLQCGQVSPNIGENYLKDVFDSYTKEELLVPLLRVLVPFLPQCTHAEWFNITITLRALLNKQIVHVPMTTEFINELPLIDFKVYSVELATSSIFLMFFELLGDVSCHWSYTPGLWQHTVKCYVAIIKDLLSNIQDGISTDHLGRGFLIGQILSHSLKIMSYIPEYVKAQLFILILELLSILEESTESTTREMYRTTKQFQIFENLIVCMTDNEEKNTLMQKVKALQSM